MRTTDRTHPLTELRLLLRGSVNLARRARNYLEQLGWESAEEMAEEVVKHEQAIAADAYSAEQNADLALKGIAAAQAPDSDGGTDITPNEAQRLLVPYVAKAREKAHTACEAATI